MKQLLTIEEFEKFSGLSKEEILDNCKNKTLNCKKSDKSIYIEIDSDAIIPLQETEIIKKEDIAQKTIAMLLNLHEKVLLSKEESISLLKEENKFLKDSIYSLQEIYEDAQKTIKTLQTQLQIAQEELEFCKRKYKLMWGKVLKKEEKEE